MFGCPLVCFRLSNLKRLRILLQNFLYFFGPNFRCAVVLATHTVAIYASFSSSQALAVQFEALGPPAVARLKTRLKWLCYTFGLLSQRFVKKYFPIKGIGFVFGGLSRANFLWDKNLGKIILGNFAALPRKNASERTNWEMIVQVGVALFFGWRILEEFGDTLLTLKIFFGSL